MSRTWKLWCGRAPALQLLAKALQQRIMELTHFHSVQQVVPDPVGVHNLWIERIGDPVCSRDELEVRQRAGELLEVSLQAAIDTLLDGVVEEEAIFVAAAI